jgi:hypothetical protein
LMRVRHRCLPPQLAVLWICCRAPSGILAGQQGTQSVEIVSTGRWLLVYRITIYNQQRYHLHMG